MTNEVSNSIGHLVLYWPNIENVVLTPSSCLSFIRLNYTLWLIWWLIWFIWSFNLESVTSFQTLNKWGGFPPL